MKRVSTFSRLLPVVAFAAITASACGGAQGGPPAPNSTDTQVLAGFEIAKSNNCFGCHRVEGKGGTSGPPFDVSGTQVQLTNGSKVEADADYLRRALTDADAQVPQGYRKGIMSSAVNGSKFSAEELDQLVAYLQAVRKP